MTAPLTFLNPQAAQLLNMVHQVRSYERLTDKERISLRNTQLHRLLLHAWRYSPFWKQRLNQAGFDPKVEDLRVLYRLPTLSRTDLQSASTDLRARWDGLEETDLDITTTSGSTGQPVRVERFKNIHSPLYRAVARTDDIWHDRNPNEKICFIGAGIEDVDHCSWGGMYDFLGFKGRASQRAILDRSTESHLQWLIEQKPQYLKTSPFLAESLAKLALSKGIDLPIKQILSQSELVSPQHRRLCKQAFGATIVDRYSCEEIGWIALQCPQNEHFHVIDSNILVEIVDNEGHSCPPGTVGRVLITSLHSFAMPIIRYDIGDLAEWGEPCSCGITLPVIKRLWGRIRHQVQLPSGEHTPMPFLGDDIGKIKPIREFQIKQYNDGILEIQVDTYRALTDPEKAKLQSIFDLNGLSSLKLHITETKNIDWGAGWKRSEFIKVDTPWSTNKV